MNKTAIKNFAIWARNKLISDISYRAGLMGITADGIQRALPQSTGGTEFYDIGTAEPYAISGEAVKQRRQLADVIRRKERDSDYLTAYRYIIEEVAYTWFNRLIAVRFMEVNEYLPSRVRVLSSETGKVEPDLVTNPFDADLPFTNEERQKIMQLKLDNRVDELFRLLFVRQCNALNEILPALFEKTNDYTELLLSLSVIDEDGVVYHLVHDIPENDFNVAEEGQVEIIGWLYQYYNTELNEKVYDGNMSKSRIPKELLPAATTIYTPDWVIRYMVQNSLGRLWLEGHPSGELKDGWKYYLEEAMQEPEVVMQLEELREKYRMISPEDIKVIDPCMGSGHILVYCFEVLVQIYTAQGYSQRDAVQAILEHNLFGLDVDDRAAQLSYFAVMMKARQYDRRIFSRFIVPHIYGIDESNDISRNQLQYFGASLSDYERSIAFNEIIRLLDALVDAKEYGSILHMEDYNWDLLYRFVENVDIEGQINLYSLNIDWTQNKLYTLVEIGHIMAQKYDIVVTNPPYLGSSRFSVKLDKYIKENYANEKSDLSMVMYKRALTGLSRKNAYVAFITTSSWMFLSSFEKMREFVQNTAAISSLIDFGTELFEGKVGHNPIVAWVTYNCPLKYRMTAMRLVDYCYSRRDEKESEFFSVHNRYTAKQNNFSKIPGSPVAYWVGENFFKTFEKGKIIGEFSEVSEGIKTGDNNRFLRLWQEIDATKFSFAKADKGFKWYPHHKGGEYRKWYGNLEYVINWENGGEEIRSSGNSGLQGKNMYFKEFASWSKISSKGNPLRYYDKNVLFDSGAPALSNDNIKSCLALFNTVVGRYYLQVISPTLNLQVGDVKALPLITDNKINPLVEECIKISKNDWDSFETSWDFHRHPLVVLAQKTVYKNMRGLVCRVEDAFFWWNNECNTRFAQLKTNEEELNRIFINNYGLQDELTPEVKDKDVTVRKADLQRDIKSLLSYAIGCMFGRYSLDADGLAYAGGEWDDSKYLDFIPDKDNIIPITDEEYLEDDIIGLLCVWMKKVYGADSLEENFDYIAKAVGSKGSTSREIIRNYFLNDFMKDHTKVYQKRPIYWLFDSGKQNGFKALIYLHRYTPDTIGNLRIDYLHRMQRIYESESKRMQDMIDHSTNTREVASASKRKEKLQKQLKECREYDEKIAHLALSRIELDLDDGVKVNYEKIQTASDGKKYHVLAKI